MQTYCLARKAIQIMLFVCLFPFLPSKLVAQSHLYDSCQFDSQLDMKDLLGRFRKSKFPVIKKEAKNFQFAILPAGGYTSNTGVAIALGANALFTLKGATKESSALTSITYTQYSQTILPFQVSIWTRHDRFNVLLDYRYINYPTSVYGLGDQLKIDTGYTVNFSWLKLHQSILTKVGKNMYLGLGLYYDYFWNISEKSLPTAASNTRIGFGSAFEYYTDHKIPADEETAFGPAFKFLYDSRNNPVNASKGIYFSSMYHPSFKSWGSDDNWATWMFDARKYISLSENKYKVLALWAYYWGNSGNPPFLLYPSTGWDDLWNTGRGFSQGRYRGANMFYLESEYRFQITKNGLLGGVLFTNLQHFPNEVYTSYSKFQGQQNANVTAMGFGTGLRVKFNKCSKTNLAIDMGFGQSMPKPWFAINLGEVF
jgi:hypothetical protein